MFKFAIRDDDPNYFTEPATLEDAYAGLPDSIPVSFAVVPFHGCTRTPAIPEQYWVGDEEFPLEKNDELVKYLRDGLSDGSLSVMLHGYNHVKYEAGPEFVAGDGLHERVMRGRRYLEDLLDTEINVFVPPNNSFSQRGLNAVKAEGLRTFYYPTPLNRTKTVEVASVVVRDLWFKYCHKDCGVLEFLRDANRFWRHDDRSVFMPVRPIPYSVRGGKEVTAVSLTRSDDDNQVNQIQRQMELANEHDGVFCLAVHFHAFEDDAFKERFYDIIEYARQELDPEFVPVEALFS